MNNNEIINQKDKKDKTLFYKVAYRLLEVKGVKSPVGYFGLRGYRRFRHILQNPYDNMHLSKITWLADKLDVSPQFIVDIIRKSKTKKIDKEIENENIN